LSYQLQFRALVSEFRKAGLNPDSAVRIARILGNSLQSVRRGPEIKDTTPRDMRQVTGGKRKHHLTNLDFDEGDPYHRSEFLQETEERLEPQQASTLEQESSPIEITNKLRIIPGNYVYAGSRGEDIEVGLRIAGIGPFLTQDTGTNSVIGISLRAEAEAGVQGAVRLFYEPRAGEYILKLQLDLDVIAEYVKDYLEGKPGQDGTDGRGGGSGGGRPNYDVSGAFVDVSLGQDGLCFTRVNGESVCLPVEACEGQ